MSAEQNNPPGWTGERYVPEIGGSIRLEHVHRYLIARELSPRKRVLDIACGEGYGADMLAAVAAHVVGVDIAADVIATAASKYNRPNLEFRQGACEAIPLPDDSVDVVVSFETLEHIERHEDMLREIRRVLCDAGLLVISSPERHEYSDVIGNRNPFHVKELYRDEFVRLLRSHFQHVAVAGQRVGGGSIVGPLDESASTRFVTFPFAETDVSRVQSVDAPVYLLAVACDKPLPAMPVGLLDGGPFAWAADVANLLAQAQDRWAEEIAHGQAALHAEIAGARVHARALEIQLAEANVRLSDANVRLDDVNVRLNDANMRLNEANALLVAANRELSASRAVSQIHTATEERLQHTVRHLQAQIDIYERSLSWRLTAPLRGARRRLGRAGWRAQPRPEESPKVPAPLPETPPVSVAPTADEGGPLPGWFYSEATTDYVPLDRSAPVETRIKLIAFYLPQFHPIPENDAWWGKGFTEWTSVTRAKPQFEGHYQPHLPGELGFYDLRLPGVQQRQIELARLHGIHAFCYHHYWFHGKRLLRQPLEQVLDHPELDFPFCLCWANENWTRTWDGLESEVLLAQQHSAEDDLAFIRDIEPALRDRRYVRVEGRPLLVVYRPALFPEARATAERWRTYCREAGIGELFLMSTHAFDARDPREFGFDAALEFTPNSIVTRQITAEMPHLNPGFCGAVFDYRHLVEMSLARQPPDGYELLRSVTPMWDNEARRPSRGAIFANSSPALYQEWLKATCRWTECHVGAGRPFVFVNAWNEWGEGAHLEPDRRYGYAYLQATAEALEHFPIRAKGPSIVCVLHDAHFMGAQVLALNLIRTLTRRLGYNVEAILCGPGPLVAEFEAAARVHDFASPDLTREAKLAVVRRLYDLGARIAICNTSVVGEAVELLKLAGFSVVSLIHELPGLIHEYKLETSVERIARHADRLVFPAEVVRDSFIGTSSAFADRSVVQPQGLFAPNKFFGHRESARRELRERLGLPATTRIALAVGYADHRKGVDLFAEVAVRVAGQLADVAFVWVGHGERSAFERARASIEAAGLDDRVLFPGPIRDSDLFFAGADAYLMTSREDPFPSVILQALDAGLPVIGFEGAGGFVDLLRRGCGVLVPLADTRAMADVLLRVLRSPGEREQLALTGREILAREFSFVNYCRTLVELVPGGGPRVSVVVPSYNYARYLPERLKSIINQTCPPHEVLFLDDCSTDDSVDVAAEILHASGLSYRIITNGTNQGTYRQWLRGFREATGDLIWIAEADDDCAPDLLEKLIVQFEQPGVMLAYCQSRQIDEDGRELAPDYLAYTAEISETKWRARYVRAGVDEIRDTLVVKNTIPNVSAVLMRRTDLSTIEHKLVALRNAGDWLLYTHLLERGHIAFVPEVLNSHRRHASSVTIGHGGLNLMREILMVQQHVVERHSITPDAERRLEISVQRTYEYLGLGADGPPSYKDHEALRAVQWAVIG